MQNSKTFRLFISSTFNDFRREREVLQTKVLPLIKEYASSKGYTFQPIDLRWGINDEAQLDQKTLELCLNEVKSCKSYPYPNFLLMLGDRYGWVPLPYAIEKNEFETIQGNIKDNDESLVIDYIKYKVYDDSDDMEKFHYEKKKSRITSKQELLQQWYTLDENQIPVSYIINERVPDSDYKIYENWEAEENALRDIFHAVLNESALTKDQKRKYFTSATEAEIEEGIIPYINHTEYQKELLKKNKTLEEVDPEYIFGFFRNIDKSTQINDMFIQDDYKEAQDLKNRVKKTIVDENILEVATEQIDKENLDKKYLIEFEKRIISFLKNKIDDQIANEKDFTPLEIELQAQEYFAEQKRKNFIGQKKALDAIDNYIKSDESQPLIIHGSSGLGKSSIMAEAINSVTKDEQTKVLYKFVGATPHSSSSKEILISIFEQLGIDVSNETDNDSDGLFLNAGDNQETFEQFSYRIYDEILNLKDDVVIFIDAVDQLVNCDQFLWLPNDLSKNVKIIISALDDVKYAEDSAYFSRLKEKSDNTHELEPFTEHIALLNQLLKEEKRMTNESQKAYFLRQYNKVKMPLYISVAVQEMKHWKSDEAYTLADTQEGIIKEFIENLSELYHHEKEFVQKVLGYIYASKDGLSESEILQLISTDGAFVKRMASDIWHENLTHELPLIIWTRLYTQLKPFLSMKYQNGEELLYFFHREFEDVVKNVEISFFGMSEHDKFIIDLTSYIMKNDKYKNLHSRLSSLYIKSVLLYKLNYMNDDVIEICNDKLLTANTSWLKNCLNSMDKIAYILERQLEGEQLNVIANNFNILSKKLYKISPEQWLLLYVKSLDKLASANKINVKYYLSILSDATNLLHLVRIEKKYTEIYMELNLKRADMFILNEKKPHDAVKILIPLIALLQEDDLLQEENSNRLFYKILNSLLMAYIEKYNISLDVDNLNKGEEIVELFGDTLKEEGICNLYEEVSTIWNHVGELYLKLNQFGSNETQMLELKHSLKAYMESKKLRHILYQKNHIFYRLEYINVLKNLANTYGRMKNYKMAVKELTEAEEICVKAYQKTPNYIADLYTTVLNNLADMYAATECFSVAISIYEKALSICLEYGLSDTPIVSQSLELTKSVFEYSSSCGIIGRNDLCPCRSGKKYKKCCGKN